MDSEGQQFLMHLLSKEFVVLNNSGAAWHLHYDSDGKAYISDDTDTIWADEVLKQKIMEENGEIFIVQHDERKQLDPAILGFDIKFLPLPGTDDGERVGSFKLFHSSSYAMGFT
eukprot:10371688-Lingulodinium_polyedra.AAC.1